MSWSLFKVKMLALTGQPHVSTVQFAQTIATGYHQAVTLHFETMSGGGKIINNAPNVIPLYNGILSVCQANMNTHAPVQLLTQITPYITAYWSTGITIIGPLATINVISPGVYTGLPIVQNNNFSILVDTMIMCFRSHIATLVGICTYTTVIPPIVVPWSGATLISLP